MECNNNQDGNRREAQATREETAAERARRERVREVSERVRAENREILDRLATK